MYQILLDDAIALYNENTSLSYFESENVNLILLNLKKYPSLFSEENLSYLFKHKSSHNLLMSSFILDNLIDKIDYLNNYKEFKSKEQKKNLANSFGYSNIFELYAETREQNILELEKKVLSFLKNTENEYLDFLQLFPNEYLSRTKLDTISKIINNHRKNEIDYFFTNIMQKIISALEKRGIMFVYNNDNRVNVQFSMKNHNVYINLIKQNYSFEHMRAIFHALGHAFYFLQYANSPINIISSNIIATETWALHFENLLANDFQIKKSINIPEEYSLYQKFLTLYYARLYATRIIFEKMYYYTNNIYNTKEYNDYFSTLYETHLHIINDHQIFMIDNKPVCIDFFNSLYSYLHQDNLSKNLILHLNTFKELIHEA